MREVIELLRREPRARVFFAVLTQSSLGTGAGYIALLLIAQRALRLSVGGEPGAAGRRGAGDAARAGLRRGCGPLVAALVHRDRRRDAGRCLRRGGAGGQLRGHGGVRPAGRASGPACSRRRRSPRSRASWTSPAGCRPPHRSTARSPTWASRPARPWRRVFLLLGGSAEAIVVVNAVSFGVSAVVLALLRFGPAPKRRQPPGMRRLAREARRGRACARSPG